MNGSTRLLVFCGSEAQKAGIKAGELAKQAAKAFGGSGGGDAKFAQGGGAKPPDSDAIKRETVAYVKSKLKA